MKVRTRKMVVMLWMLLVLSVGSTVFAASGVLSTTPTVGSVTLQAGGVKKNLFSSKKLATSQTGISFRISSATQTISKSYPLYFRIRDADGNACSSLRTITTSPSSSTITFNSYYSTLTTGDVWYFRGQTDSSSTYGVTIRYDYLIQ